jgi:hypothetical protein
MIKNLQPMPVEFPIAKKQVKESAMNVFMASLFLPTKKVALLSKIVIIQPKAIKPVKIVPIISISTQKANVNVPYANITIKKAVYVKVAIPVITLKTKNAKKLQFLIA